MKKDLMKIKELCTDERPREKMLAKGPESLSNTELLAILLRTGTGRMNVIDLARELLKSGDMLLTNLASMSPERMSMIEGIGPSKAITVAAAFELGRRCATEDCGKGSRRINGPKDVSRIMMPQMRTMDHEECWVLFLNKTNDMIGKERISYGGMESTVIDNKVIIRRIIEKKAMSVILIHNHPSGNAYPSKADITYTDQLGKALKTCGLSLLDHVIIGKDNYYSFADEQLYGKEKF